MKAYVFAFSGTSIEGHWAAEVDHHDVRLTEGAIIHGTKARAPTENMAVLCCSNAIQIIQSITRLTLAPCLTVDVPSQGHSIDSIDSIDSMHHCSTETPNSGLV